MESGREVTMRAHALTIWAAARERAVDELSSRAARLAGEGQKDEAAGIRAAARLLRVQAIQERAQAAACWANEVSRACAPCRTSLKLDQCLHEPASGRVSGSVLYWTRVDVPVCVVPRNGRAAADLASTGA